MEAIQPIQASDVSEQSKIPSFEYKHKGSRYYKCDLQMQTPMDSRHWRDDATRLVETDSDERKLDVARQYLRRCHEVGLEVIGITDHNFASAPEHSFIRFLREVNEQVATELSREPITIFPGFEIQADVGKGYHVLSLLPKDTDLQVVNDLVTTCGLPTNERFERDGKPKPSNRNLKGILDIVQSSPTLPGVVICPHSLEAKGVLNDDVMEMWLQQEEFTNLDLLCIELPKPVEEFSTNFKKLLCSEDGCDPGWKRERSIACIMSSDCYRLTPELDAQGEPTGGNYIGYRYTWIKMSEPSIESLRQAFIDHQSRIRLTQEHPNLRLDFPKIIRIEVNGASFYQAGPVSFSPNLNSIIGGRGSGKSTLLDYLRLALDRLRDGDLPGKLHIEIPKRINDTLSEGSTITVDIEKSGVPYRVVYTHNETVQNSTRVVTRMDTMETNSDWSVRTLFPVRILSQREIDESVDSSDHSPLINLLDGFITPELDALRLRENEIKGGIRSLDLAINTLRDKQNQRSTLTNKKTEFEARLKRLEKIKEPLEQWAVIEKQNNYLEGLFQYNQNISQRIEEILLSVIGPQKFTHTDDANQVPTGADSALDILEPDPWEEGYTEPEPESTTQEQLVEHLEKSIEPNKELIDEAYSKSKAAINTLKNDIENALESFKSKTTHAEAELYSLIKQKWVEIFETEQSNYLQLKENLQQNGDDPDAFRDVMASLDTIQSDLANLDKDLHKINELENERRDKIHLLRKVWLEQTTTRTAKANELMDRLRPNPAFKPLVEIQLVHQGEETDVIETWSKKIQDKRRLNEQDIETFLRLINTLTLEDIPISEKAINGLRNETIKLEVGNKLGNRAKALFEVFNENTLRELELERAEDKIIYNVHRQDGSFAGPIDKVSVGQKGLAFLNLLLASGDMPLLVDTPEEGLDNEGVYSELVPIFRKEKDKRQIIVITHNANIPVNADSELIIALEATGSMNLDIFNFSSDALQPFGIEIDHLKTLLAGKDWHKEVQDYLSDKQTNMPEGFYQSLMSEIHRARGVCGKFRRWRKSKSEKLKECTGGLDKPSVKQAVQDIMEGSESAFKKRWEKYGF